MNWLLNPVFIWFVIGVVLIVAEFFVPGVMLVFFGASAWVVAAVAALVPVFNEVIVAQVIVWIILSLLLLFTLRKWLTAQFTGFTVGKDDLAKLPQEGVGARVEVVEPITSGGTNGRVRWKGTLWKATADVAIPVGATVEIVAQNNLVITVKPCCEQPQS